MPKRCPAGKVRKGNKCVHKWDAMDYPQRMNLLSNEYPFDYLLYTEQFKNLSKKNWSEFPEGITKNHINAVLSGVD